MSLNRWLALGIFAVVAVVSLTACDFGRGHEDERLSRLTVGRSTEQDVRQTFGTPAAVRETSGGKELIYPLGPAKPHTLMLKIDAAGKYQGREDLLTRTNFARFRQGMDKVEVLTMFGQPTRSTKPTLEQQAVWEWQFAEAGRPKIFIVTFNSRGKAASSTISENPGQPNKK